MIKLFENFTDDEPVVNLKKMNAWVGILDFLNMNYERPFISKFMLYLKNYINNINIDNNIQVKNNLLSVLKGHKFEVTLDDGSKIIYKADDWLLRSSEAPISSYPSIGFWNRHVRSGEFKYIKTIDICKDPNKYFKVFVKKRVYNDMDPYGEENWDDD